MCEMTFVFRHQLSRRVCSGCVTRRGWWEFRNSKYSKYYQLARRLLQESEACARRTCRTFARAQTQACVVADFRARIASLFTIKPLLEVKFIFQTLFQKHSLLQPRLLSFQLRGSYI